MAAKTVLNYLPRKSVVHQLTGTTKLAFFLLFTFASMITYNTWMLLGLMAVSFVSFKLSRIKIKEVSFMLVFMLVFLLLNDLFIFLFDPNQGTTLYGTRTVLCHLFWRYDVTAEQLFYMFNISLKYFVALPVAILFISATDPSEFAASLNSIGVSYKIGSSVAIALRYIPDIQRDYHSISQAQQARGVELGRSEPFFKRLKNAVSILLPLILTSLNRIDTISNAMELRGFGKHEDADIRGRGLDLATVKRDYELMKWIGANCFRTSHYPYAEELYQMADEEGFLIIDEVPAVGFMESTMNFLAANQGNGKKLGYFEKETTPQLLQNHKDALTDMITRDKNHASVIAWSILNEPQCTSEGTEAYFKTLFDLAHEIDPQKRPRTYAIVMMSLPHNSKGQQFADFISLNRYYGWYVMGGMGIVDAEAAFRKEMDGWAKVLNGRPMIFTEYGADTMPTEHKLPSVMWSQEYQNEYLDMNHNVFDSYDFVQGELVWNFADFQTSEGVMRVNGNKKGIFTRQRQPKDAAFHFRARWTTLPLDFKADK